MTKKSTVELVEETVSPRALIVGDNRAAYFLTLDLKHRGCEVSQKETIMDDVKTGLKDKNGYDYIFLFKASNLIKRLVADYLSSNGKLLFIESREENISPSSKLRIFRAGDLSLWNLNELSGKILKTMFSGKDLLTIDLRKKSSLKYPALPPPPERKSVKIIPAKKDFPFKKLKLLVKKTTLITRPRFIFLIFLLFLLSVASAGWFLSGILKIRDNLADFRSHVASSDWQAAGSDLKEAKTKLQSVQHVYNISSRIFFPFKNTAVFQEAGTTLYVSNELILNIEDLLSFLRKSFEGNRGVLLQEGLTKSELRELADKTGKLEETAILAKKQLDRLQFSFIPKESFSSILTSVSEKLTAVNEMIPLAERLLFNQEPKTYLILFQNNMELRPTGGFIGSFALTTVDDGKITDFMIEDVYTADGQLKGHVDPPEPIRKYLSQPHFFLRDSNFDPDFAVSAVKAGFFLEKELGKKVDGVVGTNLFFVQNLLRATGSIRLPDFNNEEINADNFFLKAHAFAQNKFFPGSTQKKDFLTSVANTLFQNLSFGKENTLLKTLPVLKRSLEEKNIIIWSFDEALQKMIEEKGFAGRMTEIKCTKSKKEDINNLDLDNDGSCLADYLSVVEANFGVNKANYFMNKSITVEKKIGKNGTVVSVVTVSFENSAVPEVYPNENYIDYLRFFIPIGSLFKDITFNNVLVSPDNIDLANYSQDKMSAGFLLKISPGNKGVVKITYTLPRSLSSDISSYQFFFQKQGGDKISPLVLSLTYPKQLKIKPLNFTSASSRDNEIYYTTDTSVDRVFAVGKDN